MSSGRVSITSEMKGCWGPIKHADILVRIYVLQEPIVLELFN